MHAAIDDFGNFEKSSLGAAPHTRRFASIDGVIKSIARALRGALENVHAN
jgi:hypothetical protein